MTDGQATIALSYSPAERAEYPRYPGSEAGAPHTGTGHLPEQGRVPGMCESAGQTWHNFWVSNLPNTVTTIKAVTQPYSDHQGLSHLVLTC
jgi:hypothetical protein